MGGMGPCVGQAINDHQQGHNISSTGAVSCLIHQDYVLCILKSFRYCNYLKIIIFYRDILTHFLHNR